MKKIFTLCFALAALLPAITAQDFTSQTYPMVTGSDALYSMAGADTLVRNGVDTFESGLLPIGFHFQFCAQTYDSLSISADGFIRLGKVAVRAPVNNLDTGLNNPMIAPYWDDLATGSTGHISTMLTGAAPNRRRVIQWRMSLGMFQLVLHERTGTIKFIYSSTQLNQALYSVGLVNFLNGRQQKVNVSPATSTASYNSGAAGYNFAISSKSYTFLPDSTRSAKPGNLTTHSGADCAVLCWSDSSVEEVVFNAYRSADSVYFEQIDIRTTQTKTSVGRRYLFHDYNLQSGTKYYYRITANTMGGIPSDTLFGSVVAAFQPLSGVKTIPGDYSTISEAYEHITCAGLSGPTYLELQSNYDTLIEIFPINIDGDYNYSAINTLTIRPAANVTQPIVISAYPSDSTAFIIGNTKFFSIDGRAGGTGTTSQLKIRSLRSRKGTLTLENKSSDNSFTNITFSSDNFNQSNLPVGIVNLISQQNSIDGVKRNIFSDCDFDGKSTTITAMVYIRSYGTQMNDSNTISNCRLRNFKYYGVWIDQKNNHTIISGNSFYLESMIRCSAGIYVNDTTGGDVTIEDNYFGGTQPLCNGSAMTTLSTTCGIQAYIRYPQLLSVQGNTFKNINIPAYSYSAIDINGGDLMIGTVRGNMLGDSTITNSISSNYFHGIFCSYSKSNNVGHFEISNNLISGINAKLFWGIFFGGYFTDTLGIITVNVHHNTIGYPGLQRSINSYSPTTFLSGIIGHINTVEGQVRITDNTVSNIWGCDTSLNYLAGASIDGIKCFGNFSANAVNLPCSDSVFIERNTISDLTSSWNNTQSYGYNIGGIGGIWCESRISDINIIRDNVVKGLSCINPARPNTVLGILSNGGGLVHSNKILGLVNTSTTASGIAGIVNHGPISCINNMVNLGYDKTGASPVLEATIWGIYSENDTTDYSEYYNNSIYIGGFDSYPSSSYCITARPVGSNQYFPIKNNIFYNNRINIGNPLPQPLDRVYDFTNHIIAEKNIYHYKDTSVTLSWAVLANDSTSLVHIDPLFIRPYGPADSINMRVHSASPAIDFCPALFSVQTDIDGTTRPQTGNIDAGCYESAPLIVSPDSIPPVIVANGATTFCTGGSVLLSVPNQSGASYQWKNGGVNVGTSTSNYTANAAGVYTVEVTNIYGTYLSSNSITVTVNSPPNTPVITPGSATTFCAGGSVTLTAPSGYTYQWSNNAATQSVTITQAGNYTVTISSGNNCTAASSPITVTVNANPVSFIIPNGPTTFCYGGAVSLSAPLGLNYHWSNNANSQIIAVSQAGNYSVTVTDGNNCTSSATRMITVNQATSSTLNRVICPGSTFYFNSQNISQAGTYLDTLINSNSCDSFVTLNLQISSFVYADLDKSVCQGTSYPFNGQNLTGAGIYVDTVHASLGCDSVVTLTLTIDSLPSVVLNGNADTVCSNANAIVLIGGNPSGGSYSGAGISGNQFDPAVAGVGLHVIAYSYTDGNGCVNSASETIVVSVCTGIAELNESLRIMVYPNPATSELNIDLGGAQAERVSIYNVDGKLVSEVEQPVNNTIDVSHISTGVYIAEVKVRDGGQRVRWVKM